MSKLRLTVAAFAAACASLLGASAANATICSATIAISPYQWCIYQDAGGNKFSPFGILGIAGDYQADVDPANNLYVNGSRVTQPVSVSALPLPSGAATAALQAAEQSAVGTPNATGVTIQGNASGIPVPVTGTFSASIGGFQPTPGYAQLGVTTGSSARVVLPTGTTVVVYNTGTNPAFVTLGNGSVSATTSDDVIQANSAQAFVVGSATDIAAISTGGSTNLNISGGAGLASGWGGGGGSSGGGGAVTLASGAVASGAYSAGSIASGAAVSGAFVHGSIADLAHGQSTMANSVPVAIASDQSGVPVTGTFWQATQPVSGAFWQSTQPVSVASLPLPSGAATAANQPALNGDGGALAHVTNFPATQPVSAASLPLPSGAATSANQANVQASAGSSSALATGVQGVAGGVPVPISGSVSASFSGFTPSGYTAPQTTSGSSQRIAIPGSGPATVVVYNIGTNPAYTTIGSGSVTATTSNDVVFPNCWLSYAVGSAVDIAFLQNTGATTLNIAGGSGQAAGGCAATLTGASTVTANQGTAGSPWPFTLNTTPSLANGNGIVPTQGGSVLSATNGSYANILQGNAVLSATNGIYANQLQGNAALSVGNPSFTEVTDGTNGAVSVKPASTSALATDKSLVVQINPQQTPATNTAQVNGVTTLTGAGATGTGAQRVGVAQDTTTVAGAAPTTTGIYVTGPSAAALATSASQPTNAAQGSTTSSQTGNLAMGVASTSAPTDTNGDSWALSLNTSGGLRVDGSGVTQPVSAASLPLPSGAATSALQPTNAAQGSTTSGQTGTLAQGAVTTGSPTYTTGQTSPLSLDPSGNLRVNIVTGGGSGGTAAADASAWTAGTTSQTPIGCEYTSGGATVLSTAHMGTTGCTTNRALLTDKSSVNGTSLATATEAYGTAFASQTATVERVDAYVTDANANGSATSANSSPVVIASDQAAVAVKAASGAFATGSIASGALASGSIASGAAVSGAFVAGSISDLAHGQGTMSASVPVVIASNQSAVPVSAASGAFASGSIASGALASGAVASGAFASGSIGAGAIAAGASAGDPCTFGTKTSLPISSNATALTQIIAASGSTKIYICSIALVAPAATAFNLNTGTGSNCASSTAALIGSTTAANGMSFAANGGFTLGNGSGTIAVTAASSEICTLQSNAVQIAGVLTYVQQ